MLAPISWRTPPRHYGPWERVVSLLTEGLIARGVDVTLFATADSQTSGKLAAVAPRGYSEDATLDAKVYECLHVSNVFERAGEFEIIHNQFDFLPLSYSGLVETPVVTTIHGFSSERIVPVYEKYNARGFYVAISEADRHPKLNYAATVYHGIPMNEFELNESPEDYLVFFGRIHPDKGAAEAIEVARRTNHKLILAGIIQDETYYEQRVKPHLDGNRINYIGSVGGERRNEILGRAKALLHLINFNEPFGLSMAEAMACGTPVIATPRGSVREVVEHNASGFVVDNVEAACAAVEKIVELSRKRVREYVAAKFSLERMVDGYIKVYQGVLK